MSSWRGSLSRTGRPVRSAAERGDRGAGIGLRLLAAEAAAHAQAAAHHAVRRDAEHVRDHDLGLGRVLGAGGDLDQAFGIDVDPAGLGLEVEMLLAAACALRPARDAVACASACAASPRATTAGGPKNCPRAMASSIERQAGSGS